MRMVDILEKKAQREVLTTEEIRFAVNGFVDGTVPDYQMSALLMAILLNGMNEREGADLVDVMMHSGDLVDLSDLPGVKVDKHSTGGIGDTTTLVIAPLVAACGGTVAKMSGRGLSFTGGTLDKLEAIPGTCIEQPIESFKQIVRKTGLAIVGQTGNLVPADKKMYALRDVTATVASIPLIAASIMSKKLAAGTDAIVLDVKTGSGAFLKTPEESAKLARIMVRMGVQMGRKVTAVISDMNQPLGMAVGNALEVREAVQILLGQIPKTDRLYSMCMTLATEMLLAAQIADDEKQAVQMLEKALTSGAGIQKLREMIGAMGGDASCLTLDGMDRLCSVRRRIPVNAPKDGYITEMIADHIGTAAQLLGAGRAKKSDSIDPAVGLVMQKRIGDAVTAGEPLAVLYVNDEQNLAQAQQVLLNAVTISDTPAQPVPLVYDIIRD